MSKNNDLGKEAEELAVIYLKSKNFKIIDRNYRVGHKEIDIICKDQDTIVFVEVKYRSSPSFGLPEAFVDEQKMNHLRDAANVYMNQMENLTPLRFDIIAVSQTESGKDILHIKDAFY